MVSRRAVNVPLGMACVKFRWLRMLMKIMYMPVSSTVCWKSLPAKLEQNPAGKMKVDIK